ncbi:hypothetical protein ACFCXH_00140 [Streptomyces nojiriensis]|uniref:hypothetical protein n=1 Tax=Streptomyces nojiriensis TaxID=66374 RepID=UPI0035D97899
MPCTREALPNRSVCLSHLAQEPAGEVAVMNQTPQPSGVDLVRVGLPAARNAADPAAWRAGGVELRRAARTHTSAPAEGEEAA